MRTIALTVFALGLLVSCKGPDDKNAPAASAAKKDDDDAGGSSGVVTLKEDAAKRAGIQVDDIELSSITREMVVYGRLEEDPSASFAVRSPASGTLRSAAGRGWPVIGESLSAGTAFGAVEVRLAVTEKLALNTQLVQAKAELASAEAAAKAAKVVHERLHRLNADDKNVSDKAVQEAAAKVVAEETRAAGARVMIQTLEAAVASTGNSRALVAERAGDVMELLAQPGESVEPGTPILRLAKLDHLLARVDVPMGEHLPASTAARITPAGFEDRPALAGERVGQTLLYKVGGADLRPGMAVTVRLPLAGEAQKGIVIPRSAVVQWDGRYWAYVRDEDHKDKYVRRAVPVDRPFGNGFVVAAGFSKGDDLVIVGAQTLLSEEFKSRNEADTN